MSQALPVQHGETARPGRSVLDGQLHTILRRFADGESFEAISRDYPVSRQAICKFLLNGLGDEQYADLVTDGLIARIAEADEELATANDKVAVARAAAQARFARMDFERRRPELYGAKQEVRHVMPEPLRIVVSAPQIAPQHGNPGITIEHEPVK